MTVERLDFSKPPPGFNLDDLPRHLTMTVRTAGVWGPNVLAAAWVHYKARHDPPGLTLRQGPHGLGFIALGKDSPVYGTHDWPDQARAAAWAWYERRLALADKIELGDHLATDVWIRVRFAIGACPSSTPLWPRALAWSDADCDAVERWLADPTAELPEVLRG